jgi:hypothetical protein
MVIVFIKKKKELRDRKARGSNFGVSVEPI